MNQFTIYTNRYLEHKITGYYHTPYTGHRNLDNPDYINDLKNTFNNFSNAKLKSAQSQLERVLTKDLSSLSKKYDKKSLTVCVVPRSKAENSYGYNQLLFRETISNVLNDLNLENGSSYIIRDTDTKTTHLSRSAYAGKGSMPYPGITNDTCKISKKVIGKNILLIDDIYTTNVNIDEDVIQALFDKGANSVFFYAIGKTI